MTVSLWVRGGLGFSIASCEGARVAWRDIYNEIGPRCSSSSHRVWYNPDIRRWGVRIVQRVIDIFLRKGIVLTRVINFGGHQVLGRFSDENISNCPLITYVPTTGSIHGLYTRPIHPGLGQYCEIAIQRLVTRNMCEAQIVQIVQESELNKGTDAQGQFELRWRN
jgi:hypothetical protein